MASPKKEKISKKNSKKSKDELEPLVEKTEAAISEKSKDELEPPVENTEAACVVEETAEVEEEVEEVEEVLPSLPTIGFWEIMWRGFRSILVVLVVLSVLYVAYAITVKSIGSPIRDDEFNKDTCSCDCFDGVIKGGYYSTFKEYKSIYINSDKYSLFLIGWITLHAIFLKKLFSKMNKLFWEGQLSKWNACIAVAQLFRFIFNFWETFNMVNDHRWTDINIQIFNNLVTFTVIVTLYYLLDKRFAVNGQFLNLAQTFTLFSVFLVVQLLSSEMDKFDWLFRSREIYWGIVDTITYFTYSSYLGTQAIYLFPQGIMFGALIAADHDLREVLPPIFSE